MELENNKKLPVKNNDSSFVTKYLRLSLPKPCGFSTPRTRMPRRAYVDTSSRDVTLGALICGLNPFHSIKLQLDSVFTVICG